MTVLPIKRSIEVSWGQAEAFERFTDKFGEWWPKDKFSIGGERIKKIVFERKTGGLIYEEHTDGRRFQWGEIVIWEPPKRLEFKWHPSRDSSSAQLVEIEFVGEGTGTRLKLTSIGWENFGKGAQRARNGYDAGWRYVLNTWAGRRTAQMLLLDSMIGFMTVVQKFKGGRDAQIARAEGEMGKSDK